MTSLLLCALTSRRDHPMSKAMARPSSTPSLLKFPSLLTNNQPNKTGKMAVASRVWPLKPMKSRAVMPSPREKKAILLTRVTMMAKSRRRENWRSKG